MNPSPSGDKAQSAFRDYAAAEFKIAPKLVNANESEEEVAPGVKAGLGRLRAFHSTTESQPGVWIRGWALSDGTVVTRKQNLGVLFDEAGTWAATPRATPEQIAQRLVWSFGMGSQLLYVFRGNVRPPAIEKNPDGSGAMKFLYKQVSPPPGRPMEWVYEVTVTLGADHKATLALSDNLNK